MAALEGRLPRHHEVLRRLIEGVRGDARVMQLSVACSLGRGAGDELSDIDAELSLEPGAWPAGLELVEPLVRSAGPVVELLHHRWGAEAASRRTAVVYENGVQLDLMVWPASVWSGMHPPDTVVLHATRAVFTRPWEPSRGAATAEQVQEWWFLGWWALLDADKYLRRGSVWEAQARLEEARAAVWRLCAVAQGLPFAEHGITALLDAPQPRLPAGMEATSGGIDADGLRATVERCAEVLEAQWEAAAAGVDAGASGGSVPELASWARRRLARGPLGTD
jgi:hypothetical protein